MLALFLPVFVLVAVSLVTLSALSMHLFFLQTAWVLVGACIVAFFFFVDARSIFNARWLVWGLYGFSVLLLLVAYFAAPLIRNTRSWIVLGPFTLQPVELVKIALILLYANYFSRRHLAIARWKYVVMSFFFFIIPAAISVKLPDLGSAVIFFGIWFGFLLFLGLPLKRTLIALLVLGLAAGFIWTYVLRDYHRARIVGFLYPQQNSLGVNYSTAQAKIAIGSGGFFGKGYGQGLETQLGFLSEPSQDFIFAAIVEEWGFLGGMVVVIAFLFLIFQILKTGSLADENFEKCICLGAAMMFGVQFLLNTGSATGLAPVVGVTFPFLSYGGSSMVANLFILGIVGSIRKNS